MNESKFLAVWVLILLSTNQLLAQVKICGTDAPSEAMVDGLQEREEFEKLYLQHGLAPLKTELFEVPIFHHVVRSSDGVQVAVTDQEIEQMMAYLNGIYAPANISFYTCGIDYINNTAWFNQFTKEQDEQLNGLDKPYVINFYYFPDLVGLHGYAKFPETQIDRIVMDADAVNTSTTAHELGHYFSLLHTFSTSRGEELVRQTNCSIAGDLLCDTKPDPGSRSFFSDCRYIGSERDGNGDAYDPDGFNIMGKGQNYCRNFFSPGQLSRIQVSMMIDRYYLVGCDGTINNDCQSEVTELPYYESFERGLGPKFWQQDLVADDKSWSWGPITPTEDTGPFKASAGNYFAYVEASNNYNKTFNLLSPCINLQDPGPLFMSFDYQMYGSAVGTLELEVEKNGNGIWESIWSKNGSQSTNWKSSVLDLSALTDNQLRFRFSANTKEGSAGDMAIDNILLTNAAITSLRNKKQATPVLYPNPIAYGNPIFVSLEGDFNYTIYSINGQLVAEGCIEKQEGDQKLELVLRPGWYAIGLEQNGRYWREKLLVK